MKNSNIIACNNIRYYRKIKGITQSQLANMCGLSKNAISDIERDLYNPSIITAYCICLALEESFENVFYFIKVVDID